MSVPSTRLRTSAARSEATTTRLDPARTREAMQANGTLGKLPVEEIERLASRARLQHYTDGETIFSPQTRLEGPGLVLAGRIRHVSTSRGGNDTLLFITPAGELFGEIGILDGQPWQSIALAEDLTSVAVIHRDDFMAIFDSQPSFALSLIRRLCQHVRIGSEIVDGLMMQDAGARLLNRLMILGRLHGRVEVATGALRIRHGLSQQGLAESANLSRVSVNRQLREWKALGLATSGKGYVEIPDLEALEARVWRKRS